MTSKKYLPGPESYQEFRETGPWNGDKQLSLEAGNTQPLIFLLQFACTTASGACELDEDYTKHFQGVQKRFYNL